MNLGNIIILKFNSPI